MTAPADKQQFKVGHITFETSVSPRHGTTFALIAGEAEHKPTKPMFTGCVEKGMGTQLRRLAHHFDELEREL